MLCETMATIVTTPALGRGGDARKCPADERVNYTACIITT